MDRLAGDLHVDGKGHTCCQKQGAGEHRMTEKTEPEGRATVLLWILLGGEQVEQSLPA